MGSTAERLLNLLVDRSYRFDPKNKFKLASGKLSDYYLECKLTSFYAPALPLIGEVFYERVKGRAAAVGGLTQGADPLALATAYYSTLCGNPIRAFSVRKEPKKHGTQRGIEGCVSAGDQVIVLDDVVTTGGSTIQAIRICRQEGLIVVGVVVLVDREEEDGMANIQKELGPNLPVEAIFCRKWRPLKSVYVL